MRTRSDIKASRLAKRNPVRAGRRQELKRRAKEPKQKASKPNTSTAENGQPSTPAPRGKGRQRIRVISPRIVNRRIETYEKTEEVRKKLRLVTAVNEFALQHGRSSRRIGWTYCFGSGYDKREVGCNCPFLVTTSAYYKQHVVGGGYGGSSRKLPPSCAQTGRKNPDGVPDIWSLLGSLRQLVLKLEDIVQEAKYVHH